jgi:prepilin-type N-terminal cleavage/methylation domain-containing protein
MNSNNNQRGFNLIELLTVVAIIGVLAAIALSLYPQYTMRARAADILVKYDVIRTKVNLQLAQNQTSQAESNDCAALTSSFETGNLMDEYAKLAYGFEAVTGGYRPVLTVCAKADASSKLNVQVAKAAYETMVKNGSVEKGAVVTDTVVSFSLPLTSGNQPICKNAPIVAMSACGSGQAQVSPPQTQPQPKSQADCASHQHFVQGMGCNNVCNPGMYFVAGPPASCSSTPPQQVQVSPPQTQPQPKSQADCASHQHFVQGMGCNNVCNPGMYFVAGPPASCSSTPPQQVQVIPKVPNTCSNGQILDQAGVCFTPVQCTVMQNQSADRKSCIQKTCPNGLSLNQAGVCVEKCTQNQHLNPQGRCVGSTH